MRPQSEIRVCIAAALLDGPGTCKQIAQRTGWSIGMTRTALDNMVRAGDVASDETVRVPGVKRPVPVYRRAVRHADIEAANDTPYQTLIAAWMGRGGCAMGVAM